MDKFKDRLKENYGKINNTLEELLKGLNTNNDEKIQLRMKVLSNVILATINNTDFEKEIIDCNTENFYNKDKTLKDIIEKRKENSIEFLLKESKKEYLTENLTIISSRIGDKIKKYIEEDSTKIGIKNTDRVISTLKELNNKLDLKRVELTDNIKESKEDKLEYHNPKIHSFNYNRFVDEVKKSKLKLTNITPQVLNNISENLALNKLSHNFLEIKEKLFIKCINYPSAIDIAKQEDVSEYNKEKTNRVILSSNNEYMYSQMHVRKSIIDNLSPSKLCMIYDGDKLDKTKSTSVPIHLSEEEIKEYMSKCDRDNVFKKLQSYDLNRGK